MTLQLFAMSSDISLLRFFMQDEQLVASVLENRLHIRKVQPEQLANVIDGFSFQDRCPPNLQI